MGKGKKEDLHLSYTRSVHVSFVRYVSFMVQSPPRLDKMERWNCYCSDEWTPFRKRKEEGRQSEKRAWSGVKKNHTEKICTERGQRNETRRKRELRTHSKLNQQ